MSMFTHAYTHKQEDQSNTVHIPLARHVCFQIKGNTEANEGMAA